MVDLYQGKNSLTDSELKKMKITFLAVGSRGDLNPSCILGQELVRRGYEVKIATHNNFKSFVENRGLKFASISGNYRAILNSEVGLDLLEGKGKLRLIDDQLFLAQLEDAYRACMDSDAIIVFPLSLWGYHIAEKLQIPLICSSYVPLSKTGDYSFLKFGKNTKKWLSPLNRSSYSMVEFLSWQADRKVINHFRQEILKLSPIPFLGTAYRQDAPPNFKSDEIPLLYQYSPLVIPQPSDCQQTNTHITGYWFPQDENYQPPPELIDFIEQPQKPIYIGFGSMTIRDPEKTAQILLEAIQTNKQRAIISPGWANLDKYMPSEHPNLFILADYVPFNWLFPKLKLLIHHGGSGTTALGLKAGIPQILIPFFADQPAWADKLFNLGVSPFPIPFQKLSSKQLTQAIKNTLEDQRLYSQARELGEKIQLEQGTENAASLIKSYLPQLK